MLQIIRSLIFMYNNTRAFNSMDIDNPSFIDHICSNTGLTEEEYKSIMKLDEDE